MADMIAAPLSVTLERERVLDFTSPYYEYAGIQILMTKPENKDNLFTFADVFNWKVSLRREISM